MKSMKVILREDVKNLGKKGDIVEVSEGHGRNYLIPRGLAVPVTRGVLKEASLIADGRAKKEERLLKNARELASRLDGMTVTLPARAGEGGKLYGAVTSRDIAAALERLLGRKVDKKKIELPEPIKALGVFPVQIRLHPGVQVEIRVNVVAADS
ncbi:50S ribosomal protein L9 [Thermacetogenium phaeum DSM 12270]|uniref:Large ribosomal subunit protein bL9 n=2 Tax=Thermacetogenium phaeum TaxID=85874 RepID=K4LE39_THEPS|nr:50S ribosomal protein L9 [Thermacetogenium phaeum DSM 12270]